MVKGLNRPVVTRFDSVPEYGAISKPSCSEVRTMCDHVGIISGKLERNSRGARFASDDQICIVAIGASYL